MEVLEGGGDGLFCTGVGVGDGSPLPAVTPTTTVLNISRLMMPAITMPEISSGLGTADSFIRGACLHSGFVGSGLTDAERTG